MKNLMQQQPRAQLMGLQRNMMALGVIAYLAPYTSAPTLVQQHGSPRSLVIATIGGGTGQVIITHDFGLSAAELANGYPLVSLNGIDAGEISTPTEWYESSENPNYTVLQVGALAGVKKVKISRPPTNSR